MEADNYIDYINLYNTDIVYIADYKQYDDNIHIMNEWDQYSHLSAHIGTKLLSHFPPDFSVKKYKNKQLQFCLDNNLKPSDCVIFAFGDEEYKELNRGTEVNRLCISYQIGDKLK